MPRRALLVVALACAAVAAHAAAAAADAGIHLTTGVISSCRCVSF
jgi:hypothetical protein